MKIETLMNKSIDSTEVKDFFAKMPGKVKREKDDQDIYYIYKDAGVEIVATDGVVSSAFLRPKYGFPIPGKLTFAMSKDDVRKQLGKPDKVNDLGEQQWEQGDYRLGVAWKNDKISMIYLSTL